MGYGKRFLYSFKALAESAIGIDSILWDPESEQHIIGKHLNFTFLLFPKGGPDGPEGWEIHAIWHNGSNRISRKFGLEKDAKKWAKSLLNMDRESLEILFGKNL
jgi:hypothetical protein